MSATKSTQSVKSAKRGRAPHIRNAAILAIRDAHCPLSAAEMGISGPYAQALLNGGYVETVGKVSTGKRGRPANTYRLTKRSQALATNLVKARKLA